MADGVAGSGLGQATAIGPRPTARNRWSSFGTGGALSLGVHLVVVALVALNAPSPLRLEARSAAGPDLTAVAFEVFSAEPELDASHSDTPSVAVAPATPRPQATPRAPTRARRARPAASRIPTSQEAHQILGRGVPVTTPAVPPAVSGLDPEGEPEAAATLPSPLAAAAPASEATADAAPPHVTPYVARSLRVYDTFPRIPEPLRSKYGEHAMMLDVCVSERGQVSQVKVSPSDVDVLVRALREAVHTWRYRPLLVQGMPRPFCHVMRVVYRVGRA